MTLSKHIASFFIAALVVLSSLQANAQTKTVSGIISDKIGPLSGVVVSNKTTKEKATTDINGHFSIKAEEGNTLTAIYPEMKTMEVVVDNSSDYKINVVKSTEPDIAAAVKKTAYVAPPKKRKKALQETSVGQSALMFVTSALGK